ncbi:MAG TPA: hypothetical protein PKY78_07235 [Candidatus Omnitrophota bacterium]|nr:hypothetical protein [Candidatus Omnitrophota bacterium]HPS20760.1 hypothetical protein [Candidatus Omnitrophota bacterium]
MKKMRNLKISVCIVAFIVMVICVYSFLLGNKVFEGGFENDFAAWYFLAKGLFCSVALYLMVCILENVKK